MAERSSKGLDESDVTSPGEETLNFGKNTLRAVAEVYKNDGNEEYRKRHFKSAIYFYTEGIKVNCKDNELNAKLHSNRAIAEFYLGNYDQSLSDAKAAHDLQPTFLRAIERGANACMKLNRLGEAIAWCDKGLAVDKHNRRFLEIRITCFKQQNDQDNAEFKTETVKGKEDALKNAEKLATLSLIKSKGEEHAYNDVKKDIINHNQNLRIAKEVGDKVGEKRAYCCLGNDFQRLGDFIKAIEYHSLHLKISKEVEDKSGEGKAYCNLGLAFHSLGDFQKAIEYHRLDLKIAKELGDKSGEGTTYGNLGNAFLRLGDFIKAIEYHTLHLKISKEVEDKSGEVKAYCNLGLAFHSLGDFKKALEYHSLALKIAKELGDKYVEGKVYGNLGNDFRSLGDLRKAIEYNSLHLKIAKEVGDKAGEGGAYCNLGNDFQHLGDFLKAIENHNLHLKIAKEVGDKSGEGKAYGNLGNAFQSLCDYQKAIEYHSVSLKIAKDVGDKAGEGLAYGNLGNDFGGLGDFQKAIEYHSLHLKISKEVGDKYGQERAYGNLGNAFQSLGDFQKAIEYNRLRLKIAREVGDKSGEGGAYGSLGNAFRSLGDFHKAIEYLSLNLKLAKEVGDKSGEGGAYCNLGNAFHSLGDFQKAIEYHSLSLKIAKEIGHKSGEGKSYGNLGNDFQSLGDSQKAIEYHSQRLKIAKEVGDKSGEGLAYGNLGNAFESLGDSQKAIEYHSQRLKIAKEVGDKSGEGIAYGNLGNAFHSLGDFQKAIEYHSLHLKIAKEAGEKDTEATSSFALARSFESLDLFDEAVENYENSVCLFNEVRNLLKSKDHWKINYRNVVNGAYTGLWRILLKQSKEVEALSAAEEGRAQALADLMRFQYNVQASATILHRREEKLSRLLSNITLRTVFQGFCEGLMNFWVLGTTGGSIQFRKIKLHDSSAVDDITDFFQSLVNNAYNEIGVRSEVRCENRSLDPLRYYIAKEEYNTEAKRPQPSSLGKSSLHALYNIVMKPIADLVQKNDVIIVPDGPLWLVPYAALLDHESKYLCESFSVRLIPSLTSFKLIADSSEEHHSRTGALLVGDPWVAEIINDKGKPLLQQLKFAKEEVQMIGKIIKVMPLTGKDATKAQVLKQLSSVQLVHIAAHGSMETGEIALTPDPARTYRIPTEEDYMLTMADVLSVHLRARLVVLSCCHSGRGEIKAEGVVGIARAFMGAGARSVLVTLWAIDDEATLEFMKHFYHHLVEGRSASESLNQARKCLKEADKFSGVKYWAPFVLVGDDVTLEFDKEN